MNIARGTVISLAGAVGVGMLAWPATAYGIDPLYKRDETAVEMVAVDDDDDDDTNDDDTNTGASRETNDNTASNFTGVSRDRDLSRGDKTRDRTRDGAGDSKRDWSANQTNDRSRNDTRGRR